MSQVARGSSPADSAFALVSGLVLGAGGLGFGFALTFLVGALVVAGFGVELSPAAVIVLTLVFTQGVGCAGVALAYTHYRPAISRFFRDRLGWAAGREEFDLGIGVPSLRQVGIVIVGYLLAFGGAVAGAVVVSQLQVDTGANQAAEMGMENPEVLLLLIPASILIIGPGEELLFRGVVQGRLREVMGPVGAIAIASVIFAGLHWFAISGGSPTGNLIALGILLVPSLVFGTSYEYTGNILVPSLIHGIYNATLFSMLYVAVTYGDSLESAGGVLTILGF